LVPVNDAALLTVLDSVDFTVLKLSDKSMVATIPATTFHIINVIISSKTSLKMRNNAILIPTTAIMRDVFVSILLYFKSEKPMFMHPVVAVAE
jgi:hypothetical protein